MSKVSLEQKIYKYLVEENQQWPTEDSQKGFVADDTFKDYDSTPVKIVERDITKQILKVEKGCIKLSDIVKAAEAANVPVSSVLSPCGTIASVETLSQYFDLVESK